MNFCLENYRLLITAALTHGYTFQSYTEINDTGVKACLLRHDIDADLGAALKMAETEKSQGVRATYFLMTRSPIYNLMGRENSDYALKIRDLGHDIGLHYDQGFNPGDHKSEKEWIEYECTLIENLLNINIRTISFHQPGPKVLNGEVDTGNRYNTYDHPKRQGYHYISDSNRTWKDAHPINLISQNTHKKIQLLIHPMWWVYGECATTEEVWNQAIKSNFEYSQKQAVATERAFGRRRSFTVGFEQDE